MLNKMLLLIPFAFTLITTSSWADVRRCDATYEWQTTGGSIGPIPFGEFTAKGNCGGSTPNRCRKRARAAAKNCIAVQWERRWQHHYANSGGFDSKPPEACVGANIENYDLTTICKKRENHPNKNMLCHLHTGAGPFTPIKVANSGDIKAALEAEVCCLYQPGNKIYQFSNNQQVFVKLSAKTWSSSNNKHCKSNQVLSESYKINCQRVRENLCSQ